MSLDAKELSYILKQEIKNYKSKLKEDDTGIVLSTGDGIATVYGLEKAMLGELLLFKDDIKGMVMNLNQDSLGCCIFSDSEKIQESDIVKRTNKVVEVPVGEELLGRVIDSLGNPLDTLGPIKTKKFRPIERIAHGVMDRVSVDTPLETGIKAIDSIIPIGRGQRELIIGDRQTGKTSIAIDTIINQKDKNCICIYVAIGQKTSNVVRIYEKLKEHDAMKYSIIVSASASDNDALKYIAPYSGCAIAEYFMEDLHKDVLIVYDDLSKHAVSYRTLSLLLKRVPGREAYPGDIFYLHSKLLERACRLNKNFGNGSITALPIVETQAGDISAYIPTNIISITDGQIFLETGLFNQGQRPAINSGLSVSRVGSAAQSKAMKKVSKSLKIKIASFNELQAFSQFGSDLDSSTKQTLHNGQILLEILKQSQYNPYPLSRQVIELFVCNGNYLENIDVDKVKQLLDKLYSNIKLTKPEILNTIEKTKDLDDNTIKQLDTLVKSFISTYSY